MLIMPYIDAVTAAADAERLPRQRHHTLSAAMLTPRGDLQYYAMLMLAPMSPRCYDMMPL